MKLHSLPLAILSALFLCSCGSFEKQWQQSVADYQSGAVKSPEGPWTGTWTTKTNGHTGDLRAIVTRKPGNASEYNFKYHATWKPFFSGTFQVGYPIERQGSSYLVDGGHNLGPFGTFRHQGKITGRAFNATYSNDSGDLGAFSLKRPE